MVAGECKRPRVYLKMSSKTMYWRFGVFFVCGALCVGIVVLYNDPTLVGIISGSTSEAGLGAASPYVIARYEQTGYLDLAPDPKRPARRQYLQRWKWVLLLCKPQSLRPGSGRQSTEDAAQVYQERYLDILSRNHNLLSISLFLSSV